MTYEAARPRYTLPLAGKDYELIGTFELIEAVEHTLKEGIFQVAFRVMEMGVADTARLLAAIVTSSGGKLTAGEAGAILFNDVGLGSDGFVLVKLHLNAFMNILFSSPADREEKARRQGEAIGKWSGATSASPGSSTSKPA